MKKTRSFSKFFRQNLLFFIALFLMVSFYLLEFSLSKYNSQTSIVSRFQQELYKEIDNQENTSQFVLNEIEIDSNFQWYKIDKLLDESRLSGHIYSQDSLVYWNTQLGEFYSVETDDCKFNKIVLRNNEWYLVSYNRCDSVHVILFTDLDKFFPITKTNSLQNFQLTDNLAEADFIISDKSNLEIIGFKFNSGDAISFLGLIFLLLIYFTFFLCIIIWIYQLYNRFKVLNSNVIAAYALFIVDVLIIRGIDFFIAFPQTLKQSFIFQDTITNIYFFSTIGDILLNGMLLLTLLIIFYLNFRNKKISLLRRNIKVFIQVGASILLLFASYSLEYVISQAVNGLGYDSLLGLDFYTLPGAGIVLIILIYTAALFFLFKIFEWLFLRDELSVYATILLIVTISVVFYFVGLLINEILLLTTCFIILLLLVFKFIKEGQNISLVKQLLYIILFAAFTAIVINIDSRLKRDEHQKSSALLLTKGSDPILEDLVRIVFPKIITDTVFDSLIRQPDNEEEAINYLKSTYFHEISDRFTVQLMVCSQGELLNIQPEGFITECSAYFDELIVNSGKSVVDSTFYLINGESESIYYVGRIKSFSEQNSPNGEVVFLEFFSSIVPEGFGYTELLIDKKSDSVDLTGYSFAWYQNNQLFYKFGNFPYQTNFDFLKNYGNEVFFEIMGYRTLKLQISPEKYFIISRPSQQVTEQLVTFSLLFIAFGSIILFIFLVVYGREAGTLFTLNFRVRLQFFFIGTISLIIVLVAIITFYYLESNNASRLKTELNEKTQSVIIELQHKLSANEYISNYDEENLYQLLSKFSMVFFSDINLYDLSGTLLASSRPEIFTRGLQSNRINPKAFDELSRENQLYYLTEENIGPISYYSSYAPLVLGDNQLVGFVNLPYFARQFDVERSYFLMFSTFINLFVILGIIGTLLALLLSKILIKPLAVLQKSLASIQIEKPNTKIEWNIDDEIGLLIKEYNSMIDKLEQSTILLKHSERESAWREIARQIAHEIKNPLTPMKLNVQYLEKAYLEKDPKFDEKIKNISASLVLQIDTLDKVAEMFSDFAKTNKGNFEQVNLLETVNSAVSLFRNNSIIKIQIIADESDGNYLVLAFEKDILRVFNNLIKNSIQSIEGKPSGKVEIVFRSDENYIFVEVRDDGKGISDAAKANIFQPYFTTKTGGTGLGLAIVKNIMSEIGGEITFESATDQGTRFILKFNRFNQKTT